MIRLPPFNIVYIGFVKVSKKVDRVFHLETRSEYLLLPTFFKRTMTEVPKTQTAAIVRQQGGPVEFDDKYPVPQPGKDEVLVKILYTGVCQSGQCNDDPYLGC